MPSPLVDLVVRMEWAVLVKEFPPFNVLSCVTHRMATGTGVFVKPFQQRVVIFNYFL